MVRTSTLVGACASLALTLGAHAARADEPSVRAMKLADALAWARAHQPAVLAARARIAAAKADADVPSSQWLPVLGAAAEIVLSTTNNTTSTPIGTGGALDLARIGSTKVVATGSMKPSPSTLAGVGVGQEVFDFGRIGAQTAALEASIDVERKGAALTEVDIAYRVEAAFFAVRAAKSVRDAADAAYARALAHRDFAKAEVASGLRPPLELTRAEADLQRFDVARVRARGAVTAAEADLAAAVGVSDAALDATDDAPDAAAPPPIESALRDAASKNPAVELAASRVHEQEERTRAIRAESRPNVWVTGTFTGRGGGADPTSGDPAPGNGWAPSVPNWDVGLVFSWRVFDGTIAARASASRAREGVRRAELDEATERAAALVQRAYVDADAAVKSAPALARAREAAQANYAQVDARFKSGLATGVELADAEALRTEAEIQEALGRFEVARTRAALGRAIGEDPWKSPTK